MAAFAGLSMRIQKPPCIMMVQGGFHFVIIVSHSVYVTM